MITAKIYGEHRRPHILIVRNETVLFELLRSLNKWTHCKILVNDQVVKTIERNQNPKL